MYSKFAAILGFITFVLSANSVWANVPDLIPVQGNVDGNDGEPLDGLANMSFDIYDAAEDGELLYQAVYDGSTTKVDVDAGFFTVYLGELDDYPLNFFDLAEASELWLQMEINGESLDTRIRLAAVPFAQQAKVCEQIGDLAEDDIQPALGEACESGEFLRGWDDLNNEPICGADQIGENTSAVPNWDEMINIPDGFSDGKDDGYATEGELTSLLDDNYVGKSQADSVTSGMITDGTIGTADVDSSKIQLRGSTNSCGTGQYVSGIGVDGNVSCKNDLDTNTTYSAGDGIDISSNEISVDPDWVDTTVSNAGYKVLGSPTEVDWTTDKYPDGNHETRVSPLCMLTTVAISNTGASSVTWGCALRSTGANSWSLQMEPGDADIFIRCRFICF